jgi:hypothetical protein
MEGLQEKAGPALGLHGGNQRPLFGRLWAPAGWGLGKAVDEDMGGRRGRDNWVLAAWAPPGSSGQARAAGQWDGLRASRATDAWGLVRVTGRGTMVTPALFPG